MFIKNFYSLFFFLLISGSLLSISSNSWFISWLGLEINMMSFIPLMIINANFKYIEAAIKYFLVQALASVLLMTFFIVENLNFSSTNFSFFSNMILISLFLKLGLAPLHFWFPQVTKNIKWNILLIITTWQKIAPLFLSSIFLNMKIFIPFALISALIGGSGGINQNNMKIIFTFSSIAHSSWLILLISLSLKITFIYFSIYFLLVYFVFWVMNFSKKKDMLSGSISKMTLLMKIILSFNIMSLGGLPPFLGFFAKVLAILTLIKVYPLLVILILIISSVISLLFYLKLFFPYLTFKFPNAKFTNLLFPPYLMIFASLLIIILNISLPLMFLLT